MNAAMSLSHRSKMQARVVALHDVLAFRVRETNNVLYASCTALVV